ATFESMALKPRKLALVPITKIESPFGIRGGAVAQLASATHDNNRLQRSVFMLESIAPRARQRQRADLVMRTEATPTTRRVPQRG
ncbi:MAG: hypothetical protein ACI89X_003989, partial [Planctomycetota bacterium]